MEKVTEAKVLPFEGKQGEVRGHALLRHNYEWLGNDPIQHVVFRHFDREADMAVEHVIHWTEITKYMKKKWPACGSIEAVLLTSGRRIYANAHGIMYYTEKEYLDAPILCRDVFKITTLDGGHTLIEVAGVSQWLRSKQTAEDFDRLVVDPWKRDNDEYQRRLAGYEKEVEGD